MSTLFYRVLPICLAAMSLAGRALAQDLYWETSNTGGPKGEQTAQFYAAPKMVKIVSNDGHTVILRSDQDKLISVDSEKKTYWELPFAQMEEMSKQAQAQLRASMAQMKDKLKDLSPEQRTMIEKMMGKNGDDDKAPTVDIKAAADTKKILGYSCTKYTAIEDGKPIMVAWTTNDIKAFAAMRADWVALQKRLNETNRAFRNGLTEAYTKIEGFPMETEIGDIKTVVTKVEERAIPPSEFDPPAGFKQEPPPMGKPPEAPAMPKKQ